MKVGVTLPSFEDDARALGSAVRAEELGLDGVFVFDHLWPLGRPDRPALSCFPLLGAVAAITQRVQLGPFVARVGLLPDPVLLAALRTLQLVSGGRAIGGLGTGDGRSRGENDSYGIGYGAPSDRRRSLRWLAERLRCDDMTVWIGGGSPANLSIAREVGAAINLWEAPTEQVSRLAEEYEVTWGGPVGSDPAALRRHLEALSSAGATWAVCAWPSSLEALSEAAAAVR